MPLALLLVLVLSAGTAHAAPPTTARVDALLEAMEVDANSAAMIAQMAASSRELATTLLGPDATAGQKAGMERALAEQQALYARMLSPEALRPLHRRVYAETFSAAEVDALTRFHASPEGRSIMAEMPQVLARSMRAMQPMLQDLMEQTRRSLRRQAQPPEPTCG